MMRCNLTTTPAAHGVREDCVKRTILCFGIALVTIIGCRPGPAEQSAQSPPLIVGKRISGARGGVGVGNVPVNLALTHDGRFAVVTDAGFHQALWSIRTADGVGVSHVDFSNRDAANSTTATTSPAREGEDAETSPASRLSNGLYYGLAISGDGDVYAAQGNHDSIAVLRIDENGALSQTGRIKARRGDFPAGLALDERGHLYVANNSSGGERPFEHAGSVSVYGTATKTEIGRYTFTDSHSGTSNFPLGIAAVRDGSRVYVSAERDDAVYVLDTSTPARPTMLATIPTGAQPEAVLLSRDQSRLYVANSLGDTVGIIDTQQNRVIGTVLLRPSMARDLPGATPLALALAPDGRTLYAALADMNAVAVIDPERRQLLGYVPAGWYPTALAVTSGGKRLLVANAKGVEARNPNNRADPHDPMRRTASILSVVEGTGAALDLPTDTDHLRRSTRTVLSDNRLDQLAQPAPNPLAGIGIGAGKIKHVIYVIKENRTYDQILGDLPQGNGDPSLVLFGRDTTPNQHALAERFVLLDNLYACGEVSGDGWCWSTQGMANAYAQRNVPYHYSHRGRKFDFEGTNNGLPVAGVPATDDDGRPLASNPIFRNGSPKMPNVASTRNYIWDAARAAGRSVRNYGFFLYSTDLEIGINGGPDNYPAETGLLPAGHDLAGVTDVDYRRFDLDFADSDAPAMLAAKAGDDAPLYATRTFGPSAAASRFSEWHREFQMMLAKDSTGDAVPALMLVRLPNDHTVGAKSGKHTPRAMVADNDYALGEIVESVSRSAVWRSTAIVVIEDDAQSGIDHVDAHRTTGFVISPWIKRGSVDHRFCNTDSMLKTIELLLGLRPLSQYDAVADPILDWSDSADNAEPFAAIAPDDAVVREVNPSARQLGLNDPRRAMAIESDAMNFARADAAPADRLDEITWRSVRGATAEGPPSLRRSEVDPRDGDHDDDDD
jgi:YVTN family beta-propeller protein